MFGTLLTLLLLPLVAAEGRKDLDRLQGDWVIKKAEAPDRRISELEGIAIEILGNTLHREATADLQADSHDFTLDDTASPKILNFKQQEIGKAIYDLEGDTFRISVCAGPEQKRPETFNPLDGNIVFVLTRDKAEE